jgi:hypothetical protein
MARIYIYLGEDENDVAKETPYALLLPFWYGLLCVRELLQGDAVLAEWLSSAVELELRREPRRNRVYMTLRRLRSRGGNIVYIDDAAVPWDRLGHEAVRLGRRAEEHIRKYYANELEDPSLGGRYRRLLALIQEAEAALSAYESRRTGGDTN